MSESMNGIKRTHMCGEVNEALIGEAVCVTGWVNKKRNLGQLIFIALRDRTGVVQVVLDENTADKECFEKASGLRGEFVIAVKGKVCARTPENINPDMKTGKIEIEATELKILSEAEVPPFQVYDSGVREDLRLKYRYLDLRRPEMQRNLIIRHQAAQSVRKFLNGEGFLEIETPVLTKSTPEGARDYIVPSRVNKGNFYALPQSPQIFKQLLMVSGMDRYYQIVKCFRDEDLRADRQPEFTQIDMELSFVDIEDVIGLNERLMQTIFKDILNIDIETPFQRMTYAEAMERFGSDKPDVRFGMEIKNISVHPGFAMFDDAIAAGGSVRGINAKSCAGFSRKQIDSLVEFAKDYGAKGLAWITCTESGELKTSLSKFFSPEELDEIKTALGGEPGDLLLISAGGNTTVLEALGALRCEIAERINILNPNKYKFLWVTEFPLLEWSEEDSRFYAKHHPFTSPMEEDISLFGRGKDMERIRAKAYDMVLNGTELGGGSIRIHQQEIQEKMFAALGFTQEEAYERFGFLLEAFKYGAPPHGGIAFGLDRIVMFLAGVNAIRDVIAFPKLKDASCPLSEAPNVVDKKQLDELGISILL